MSKLLKGFCIFCLFITVSIGALAYLIDPAMLNVIVIFLFFTGIFGIFGLMGLIYEVINFVKLQLKKKSEQS